MYIQGHDLFEIIKQITPAPLGWNAVFALHDFFNYVILPVVAWAYGNTDGARSEDASPMFGGVVCAYAPGGEMIFAPVSDYFLGYLPDSKIKDKALIKMVKRRLASMKETLPLVREERKADKLPEAATKEKRLRQHEEWPIEINFDV